MNSWHCTVLVCVIASISMSTHLWCLFVYEFVTLICVWVRDSCHVRDCRYSCVSERSRQLYVYEFVTLICVWVRDSYHVRDCGIAMYVRVRDTCICMYSGLWDRDLYTHIVTHTHSSWLVCTVRDSYTQFVTHIHTSEAKASSRRGSRNILVVISVRDSYILAVITACDSYTQIMTHVHSS